MKRKERQQASKERSFRLSMPDKVPTQERTMGESSPSHSSLKKKQKKKPDAISEL